MIKSCLVFAVSLLVFIPFLTVDVSAHQSPDEGDPNKFFYTNDMKFSPSDKNDAFYKKILDLIKKTSEKGDKVYNAMDKYIQHDWHVKATPKKKLDLDIDITYFGIYVSPSGNEQSLLKYLETINALDILTLNKTSQLYIYALVPVDKIPELSLRTEVSALFEYPSISRDNSISIPAIYPYIPLEHIGQVIGHEQYVRIVNSTVPITIDSIEFFDSNNNIDELFSMMPKCTAQIHLFDHTISISPSGNIVINYTLEKKHDTTSSRVLLFLTSDSSSRSVSLDLTRTSQNTTHVFYQSIIPNSLFDTYEDSISVKLHIFSTSDTIYKSHVFSDSHSSSFIDIRTGLPPASGPLPLYFHKGIDVEGGGFTHEPHLPNNRVSVLSLPSLPKETAISKLFHRAGVTYTIYVPNVSTDTISLVDDTLCKYGKVKPNKNIIHIFDMSPKTITNSTDGLELDYKFTKQDKPKQLNWVVTDIDTGNSFWGNTTDRITNQYTLDIPLEPTGSYNIIVYGTAKQDRKLAGIYNTTYTFATSTIDYQVGEPTIPEVKPPVPPKLKPVPTIPNNTATDVPTIQITLPDSYKYDNTDRTIDLYHGISDRLRIDTAYQDGGTAYYIDDKAYITMFRDTWITNKQFTASGGQYCYVGDLFVGQDQDVSVQHNNTLSIQFRQANDPNRCNGSPDITFDDSLSLTKEVYVRFVGTDGQVPFYYTDNRINIPKCTSTNFDSTTNTLIGNTEICYGKDGVDTIIISKILTVFGVSDTDDTTNTETDVPIVPVPIIVPTMSIAVPESMLFDNTHRTIDLYTGSNNQIRIDTYYQDVGTAYHINDRADITIFRGTEIIGKSFTPRGDSYCYVGDLKAGQIDITRDHIDTLYLQFRQANDPSRCDQAPDISFDGKLDLSKEIYVRFADTDDKVPFYYINDTGSNLVDIPKCTDTNFDSSTNRLLDNTQVCYGKDGSDTVLVSKILAVFGV